MVDNLSPSARAFRRLGAVAIIATYLLIFLGGLVRVSGSGLGCPDWPKCFGRWIPPFSVQDLPVHIDPASFNFTLAWIEYVNRLAGMTVGFLILAVAILAIARFRKDKPILFSSMAAAVLTAYQGWQGGRVVSSELEPFLVSAHLVISFVIVSLLIYAVQRTWFVGQTGMRQQPGYFGQSSLWVRLLWLGAVVQIILGTQVRSGIEVLQQQFPLWSDAQWISHTGAISSIHMITGTLLVLGTWFAGYSILKLSTQVSGMTRQIVWGMIGLMTLELVLGLSLFVGGLGAMLQLFHLWSAGIYIGLCMMLYFALRVPVTETVTAAQPTLRLAAPVISAVLCVAVIGAIVVGRAEASRSTLPVLTELPEFTFVESSGEPFAQSQFEGKISVVDFFFIDCRGPCPGMSAAFAELYRDYAHSKKLQLVSFTVNPESDSLPRLRQYAAEFGVTDNRWRFVRGEADQVSWLAETGFMVSGELPGMHTTRFVLVDQHARIRGYYAYDSEASLDLLRTHIRELAEELP